MRSASLVHAKAHLSELVDRAERGQLTLICRHGKPAAALVPVPLATAALSRPTLSEEDAMALLERMAKRSASGATLTLDQALGRDRLER